MNLKQVYEIFYPGKNNEQISVWNKKPKYRSKKEFFESLIPTEIRWLNIKVWNDKARRSRFLANSKAENGYTSEIMDFILQFPLSIPRMESKGKLLLEDNISADAMNEIFFNLIEQEHILLSSDLEKHLIDSKTRKLNQKWENVLVFLFLFAIFPEKVNQLYTPYLYHEGNEPLSLPQDAENGRCKIDESLFQYEYPPDMGVYSPGDLITHTWMLKNAGEIPWENRYYECSATPFSIGEENRKIRMPEVVHPGDLVSVSVCFEAPDMPGVYDLNWKMKDSNGKLAYLNKLGLGLHFTILEKQITHFHNAEIAESNYKVIEESPAIPATLEAGRIYSHVWTLQNTGSDTWKDYYCECTNVNSFGYIKNELRFPLNKQVKPGEYISMRVEFVTPPVEGVYRFIWRILKSDGSRAFAEERKLEILLNLI